MQSSVTPTKVKTNSLTMHSPTTPLSTNPMPLTTPQQIILCTTAHHITYETSYSRSTANIHPTIEKAIWWNDVSYPLPPPPLRNVYATKWPIEATRGEEFNKVGVTKIICDRSVMQTLCHVQLGQTSLFECHGCEQTSKYPSLYGFRSLVPEQVASSSLCRVDRIYVIIHVHIKPTITGTLHYITLRYVTLLYVTLRYVTLRYITFWLTVQRRIEYTITNMVFTSRITSLSQSLV